MAIVARFCKFQCGRHRGSNKGPPPSRANSQLATRQESQIFRQCHAEPHNNWLSLLGHEQYLPIRKPGGVLWLQMHDDDGSGSGASTLVMLEGSTWHDRRWLSDMFRHLLQAPVELRWYISNERNHRYTVFEVEHDNITSYSKGRRTFECSARSSARSSVVETAQSDEQSPYSSRASDEYHDGKATKDASSRSQSQDGTTSEPTGS